MQNIRRVSVISTGSVRIRPEHARGTRTPFLWWLLTSRRWTNPRPINVYVIEHRNGVVLFDTGQDRRSVTDPGAYFPSGLFGFFYRRLARFEIAPSETLTDRLAALGYQPEQVRKVVLSHLHQDHIGGLSELADAEILVSAAEWRAMQSPLAVADGIMAKHIDLPGLHWTKVTPTRTVEPALRPFTESYDLFGDGSLTLLPTPGHTPGSLSLLVNDPGMPPLLLVGDVTYDIATLDDDGVPGVGKRRALERTTRLLNEFRSRRPSSVVLAAHDPEAARLLDNALGRSGADHIDGGSTVGAV